MASSTLPSREAKSGRNSYATRAFLGVPRRGDNISSGHITHAFSRVPIVGKDQNGYMTLAFSGFPIVGLGTPKEAGVM